MGGRRVTGTRGVHYILSEGTKIKYSHNYSRHKIEDMDVRFEYEDGRVTGTWGVTVELSWTSPV